MKKTGYWEFDGDRLPKYEYTGGYPVSAKDKAGKNGMLPEDPCFILGNYRMTLFAHASGTYELITGERGWARLNHSGKNRGWSRSAVCVGGKDQTITKQNFGVGYGGCTYECPGKVTVTKVLSVQPSQEIHKGNSSFLVTMTMENHGTDVVTVNCREELLANYRMMNHQDEEPGSKNQRLSYGNRLNVDTETQTVKADIFCQPVKLLALPERPDQRFTHDCYPPTIFMKAVASDFYNSRVESVRNELGDILCAEFEAVLEPGEEKTVQMVVGFTFEMGDDAIKLLVRDMLEQAKIVKGTGAFAHLWRQALPDLWEEPDLILRCEMLWNAYVLEAMATYSQYFKETYIPQGSVYAYHLGQNASNRDHLQHSLPLIYSNPGLAKSCIRYVIRHTLEDGEIKRQNIGYGYCDPGVYMESDPQLYMFLAVGEYLRVTKDYAFLRERVTYYPAEHEKSDTVWNMLVKHFVYLRDVVGTGQHGLVRMLNSDWSDSFFHPYSPNIYLHSAESHMNTTMALAVIPALIVELKQSGQGKGQEENITDSFVDELEQYSETLLLAFMQDMEGRSFAPRCYIGPNDEPDLKFGMDTLCLEAQLYLLQMGAFPVKRKRKLYMEIKKRVLDMEKSGARTREVPLWSKGGQGEDGGIWFSHQGPLITGIATFDGEEAVKLMKKLTFHHYAEVYPEYWVGHWTFADSLESTLSDREGLYHFWTPEAFQPFCAHAHAWMLYCYYRVYVTI